MALCPTMVAASWSPGFSPLALAGWVDSSTLLLRHLNVEVRHFFFLVSENPEFSCVHFFALPPAGLPRVG